MRCSSTVTIVMLSSSCNLDRHIIRLSSSCDFNKTHHHAITMRRRLTHARSFNTARTHAPLTRLMRCYSTVTIVMLSSSCNLDRHIIRLSSSCDFNKTHHHAITMRRRLTHARSFNTARTHAQTTRRMPCFSMENSPYYHHHIVMLSSSCD